MTTTFAAILAELRTFETTHFRTDPELKEDLMVSMYDALVAVLEKLAAAEQPAATSPFFVRGDHETVEQFNKRVQDTAGVLHSHDFECPSCGERGRIELDPKTTGTFPCPRACGAQFIEYPLAPDQWRIVCVVQPYGRAD